MSGVATVTKSSECELTIFHFEPPNPFMSNSYEAASNNFFEKFTVIHVK